MKKYFIIVLMLFCFFACSFELYSATITVGKSGADQTMINTAITVSSAGDTIEIIDSEIYLEQVTITINNITIKGAAGQLPTIENQSAMDTITFNMGITGVILENLIINNTASLNAVVINNNGSLNTIKNCKITSANPLMGTGVYISEGPNNKIVNCEISGFNRGIYTYGGMGGGVAYMFYNTIYDCNDAIYLGEINGIQYIYNNTIVNNNIGIYSGIPYSGSLDVNIKNNIIYNNTPNDLQFIDTATTYNIYLENNCYYSIQNVNPGMAIVTESENKNQDPQLNVDYTLMSGSPCIDAGKVPDLDFFGVTVPSISGNARDIGAHEGSGAAPGAFEKVKYVKLSANKIICGERTTISLHNLDNLDKDKVYVKASIYDLRGRLVRQLYEDNVLTSGTPNIPWDGKDLNGECPGSGLLLLKVQLDNIMRTRKIFFLK